MAEIKVKMPDPTSVLEHTSLAWFVTHNVDSEDTFMFGDKSGTIYDLAKECAVMSKKIAVETINKHIMQLDRRQLFRMMQDTQSMAAKGYGEQEVLGFLVDQFKNQFRGDESHDISDVCKLVDAIDEMSVTCDMPIEWLPNAMEVTAN